MRPLNGTKTHPLTTHAIATLVEIAKAPAPTGPINPGTLNRLMREGLIDIVSLPSPFKTHRGKLIGHAKITAAGLLAVEQVGS